MSIQMLTERIESVAVDQLLEHPRNPNRGNLDVIEESMSTNGFYGALVVQRSTGYILAGNHRWKVAKRLGVSDVPVIYVDVDDERALRILVADNRTSELAHRDNNALVELLDELHGTQNGLDGLGYTLDDIHGFRAAVEDIADAADEEERGKLLDVAAVVVDEPETKVHLGDVYQLGKSITLVVANPITDMQSILPYLTPAHVFLPFAGGFVGFLDTDKLLLVAQPNNYIAGYIIDRYKTAKGVNAVKQIA